MSATVEHTFLNSSAVGRASSELFEHFNLISNGKPVLCALELISKQLNPFMAHFENILHADSILGYDTEKIKEGQAKIMEWKEWIGWACRPY